MANTPVAMVNLISFFLYSMLFLFFIQLPTLSSGGGFSVDLIHRDSPLSPLYDASKTTSDRVKSAIHVSTLRAAYFREVSSKPSQHLQAPAAPIGLTYIANLSVGTPPAPFYAEIDTGSDLTWTQCLPCIDCYKQSIPLFDPTKSSTFIPVGCPSGYCQEPDFSCDSYPGARCIYKAIYPDETFSTGNASIDTFTFGSSSIPNLVFGCGDTQGFNDMEMIQNFTGFLGLGGGFNSFPSQMNKLINGKFSYRFVPYDAKSNATGKLSFGDDALLSGPGVVSTPLVLVDSATLHQVTLDSIKIGNNTFPYPNMTVGNTIIDTGTTLTFLPAALVSSIESELKQVIKGTPIPDPREVFNLCYNSSSTQFDGPPITFEFTGAEVEVPQSNAFMETGDGIACLNIVPAAISVFGNTLQVNFQVSYDILGHMVSFKQTDCSQL